jgi:hypothetical protein
MEKYGVVKDGLTPETDDAPSKSAKDCNNPPIVDNNTDKIDALDADFRKRAADATASKLANN